VNREAGIESDQLAMNPQQARRDRVECAAPQGPRFAPFEGGSALLGAAQLAEQVIDAAQHFAGGAAGEGEQQNAARIDATLDKQSLGD
jgi:hypothetical protein